MSSTIVLKGARNGVRIRLPNNEGAVFSVASRGKIIPVRLTKENKAPLSKQY